VSIEDIASALSVELDQTVFYGTVPDDADGTLDSVIALRDFPYERPQHAFGEDMPARTVYGINVHARYKTQDEAREACREAYAALLTMGFTALSPPVSLGKQDGRFEVVAQVAASETV